MVAVTSTMIAVALGVTAPVSGSATDLQWQMWISDAEMLIEERRAALTAPQIPNAKRDYVVRESVVAHVKKPDDATQVTVSIDDGSTSKSYRSGNGRVTIIDEWWTLLGLNPRSGRAFEVDTIPDSAGVYGVDYWWSTPTQMEPM